MAKLKPGDKIGPFPYQIVKQLGRGQGNMADVYLAAEGSQPGAPLVVLKISRTSSEHSDFFTDTILNESDRLKRLSHPGIVRMLPIKINNPSMRAVPFVANASLPGRPWFLVLEHLTGGSLDELLSKSKRIPELLALRIAQRLAATLDYIHRCDQVHLDIKPENVLFRRALEPDDLPDPVLIDFGIARDVGQEGLEARTLHYAPPERVLLHKSPLPLDALAKPDPSMDVYSLGIVLYQMLAGRRPFDGQNDKRISSEILKANPARPSVYASNLDSDLEALILQAMEKDPAARPSAGELAQRLEAIAVRKAYGAATPAERPAQKPKPTSSNPQQPAAVSAKDKKGPAAIPGGRSQRTGLWIGGAAVLATLALGLAVMDMNGNMPELLPIASASEPSGEGAAGGGDPPRSWWEQLMALWPGGAESTEGGAAAIVYVTPTSTATDPVASVSVAQGPTSTPVAPRPTGTFTTEPTSTPAQRPDTPTPTVTATPAATATPAVASQPTQPAVSTVGPSPTTAPSATATPPPTSTPVGIAGAAKTATATRMPAGGGGQSTPVSVHTKTPTPRPPTPAPANATPAATPTPAPAVVASLDLSGATVQLLEPVDGFSGHGSITFRWETNYQLQEGQAFEAVFWRAGGDPMRDGRGYGGATRDTSVTINWDVLNLAPDGYRWGVLLVKSDPYTRILYMGGDNGFQYAGPGNGGSNGDSGAPPTK